MKILAYLNSTRDLGITNMEEEFSRPVFIDSDCASKETYRCSLSGVALMLWNEAVYATSSTRHCLTLSTTEAEYVALAKGATKGLFVRSIVCVFHATQRVRITLIEDNEGTKRMAETPLARAGVKAHRCEGALYS